MRLSDAFDADGSGNIDAEEIKALMESLGKEPTDAHISSMMGFADKDGGGTIDFSEFCAMYGKYVVEENESAMTDLADAFRVYDTDGNGFIDPAELQKMMASLGTSTFRPPPPDFIDELIKEADVNGDGKLDFLEFSKAMLNKEGPWGGDFTRR